MFYSWHSLKLYLPLHHSYLRCESIELIPCTFASHPKFLLMENVPPWVFDWCPWSQEFATTCVFSWFFFPAFQTMQFWVFFILQAAWFFLKGARNQGNNCTVQLPCLSPWFQLLTSYWSEWVCSVVLDWGEGRQKWINCPGTTVIRVSTRLPTFPVHEYRVGYLPRLLVASRSRDLHYSGRSLGLFAFFISSVDGRYTIYELLHVLVGGAPFVLLPKQLAISVFWNKMDWFSAPWPKREACWFGNPGKVGAGKNGAVSSLKTWLCSFFWMSGSGSGPQCLL